MAVQLAATACPKNKPSLACARRSDVAGDLAQVQNEAQAGDLGSQLNGALAATFMGPVLTVGG